MAKLYRATRYERFYLAYVGVTLVLGQTFFQTAYDLSGAPQGESDRAPKHFSLGHYILWKIYEGVTTARRRKVIKCADASP